MFFCFGGFYVALLHYHPKLALQFLQLWKGPLFPLCSAYCIVKEHLTAHWNFILVCTPTALSILLGNLGFQVHSFSLLVCKKTLSLTAKRFGNHCHEICFHPPVSICIFNFLKKKKSNKKNLDNDFFMFCWAGNVHVLLKSKCYKRQWNKT